MPAKQESQDQDGTMRQEEFIAATQAFLATMQAAHNRQMDLLQTIHSGNDAALSKREETAQIAQSCRDTKMMHIINRQFVIMILGGLLFSIVICLLVWSPSNARDLAAYRNCVPMMERP